jgi:hypothetical protein
VSGIGVSVTTTTVSESAMAIGEATAGGLTTAVDAEVPDTAIGVVTVIRSNASHPRKAIRARTANGISDGRSGRIFTGGGSSS